MPRLLKSEDGVALATVMTFMVLIMILITSMLTLAGNEVVISSLQRDGVRAMELAQGGVQEAVRRIEEGRPFQTGFTGSLAPGLTVLVVRRVVGTNSAYQEIQATATVGRATRRVSNLVLQRMTMFPPNVVFGPSFEGKNIDQGDIYSRTWVKITKNNVGPDTFIYSGWRIQREPDPGPPADPGVAPCYTNSGCVANGGASAAKWYPATRLTEPITTGLGAEIVGHTRDCPAGGGPPLPPTTITGVLASNPCSPSCTTATVNVFGFDRDDPDGIGPLPPQAVSVALPCGLPYKIVSQAFNDETGTPLVPPRLMKVVAFEQWFNNYWLFDEAQMTSVKKTSLVTYPQFGAVPPVIDPAAFGASSNFDRVVTGGGPISGDFGCKHPEMTCVPAQSRPISVLLEGPGPWSITGAIQGHGTLVVNGDLNWTSGSLEYWGTIIINGTLTIVDPLAGMITGGIVSTQPLMVHRGVHVAAGSSVTSVPVGRSTVVGKAWWER